MKGGNEASFHIEVRSIHTESKLKTWTPQKRCHAAIAQFFGWVPDHFITGKVTLPILELLRADFDLLQADNVGLLFPDPLQCVLDQRGPQSVDVPRYYLHSDDFFLQDCSACGKLYAGNPMNAKLKCILCIEDEPEMIDLIRLILGRRGFEVKGAHGGVEGLKMIRQELPDLVLLDLMMPDMDGWEVYQQMKADEKTRNIHVIVVTAKAQSIDKVLGLHIAKVDDYIAKPFSPQDLMNSVERVINKTKA
jgi:CheY-like chemotaxis protein